MARSRVEMLGLQYEAENLVRDGMSRAEVSRMLGVHSQTLAQWALQGRWRKKDLDLEHSGATTRRTIRNVRAAHERRRTERQTLEGQASLVREALRLISEKGPGAVRELEALVERVRDMPAFNGLEAAPRDPKGGKTLAKARLSSVKDDRKEIRKMLDRYDI